MGLFRFSRQFYNLYLSSDRLLARHIKDITGFTPVNLDCFKLAFYHKSHPEAQDVLNNNERLEFLGDAILSSVVANYLYKKYPSDDEGFLTQMRSKIVKRDTLNDIGQKMGIAFLLKELNSTKLSKSMLGNAVEALVGAIYLERGYAKTEKFIVKNILRRMLDIHELEATNDNFKSQLLEYCQKNGKTVEYELVSKYKMDKRDRFKVKVVIDGEKYGNGDDFNKKSAEQMASEQALMKIGILSDQISTNGQRLTFEPQ